MMHACVNVRLLDAALSGAVSYALLESISIESGRTPDLLDNLSYFVAAEYHANRMTFEQADVAMNAVWAACFSKGFWAAHDRTIPPMTERVFLAFDEGEYDHESDPPGTDPEIKYTRPMIALFLAEHA